MWTLIVYQNIYVMYLLVRKARLKNLLVQGKKYENSNCFKICKK